MLTKIQIKMLEVFKEDIFRGFTFKEIKEKSQQKSNNIPLIALREFEKEGLVSIEKTGNVKKHYLNLESNLVFAYLNLINEGAVFRSRQIPEKLMAELENRISKYSGFFILLVFGSYAKENHTKKSDLDVALIVESENSKKEITPFIETIKRRALVKIDYYIFTEKEYIEMLKAEQENVGKEIYRANVIYSGFIQYLKLMRRLKNESFIAPLFGKGRE